MLAGSILLLAVAIVSNASSDVREARRMKVDKRVFYRYIAANPGLGNFGPPLIKVHKKIDLVCALRKPADTSLKASDGICLRVVSVTDKSTAIESQSRCVAQPEPPAQPQHEYRQPPPPPGTVYCPSRRMKII
ncbi:MAG: hypothetical protein NVSMB51_22160 [Solirubrobacteraceae bacterium]